MVGLLNGHTGSVGAVAFGHLDNRPIAITASHDRTARVWDLTTGTQHGPTLTGHTESVTAVAFGHLDDRPIAITGSRDRTVRQPGQDRTSLGPQHRHPTRSHPHRTHSTS
ncbi:hypothetical protein [Glycomyces tenuis]|uniref:hypothetical protein n=1 Tax=Glycomyces tenuis TaxID=58116 RepID=UPI003CCBC12D